MTPEEALFRYRARVIRVIDGDTIEAEIDHGCNIFSKRKLRLYGIDAAEMRGAEKEEGRKSADHLIKLITNHGLDRQGEPKHMYKLLNIYIHTHKDRTGKYGRYLAVLWGIDDDGELVDLNQKMVDDGYAEADKR